MRKFFLFILFLSHGIHSHLPTEIQTQISSNRIKILLQQQRLSHPQCLAIPEGAFVYPHHPIIAQFLTKRFTSKTLEQLQDLLNPHLSIPLTKEGFSMASSRRNEEEVDETNYSAIWVRDCCWHYYGLKLQDRVKAKRLVLSLLDFYTTDDQMFRFINSIKDPTFINPRENPQAYMQAPLIRFSSKTLSHHQFNGEDQLWNHLQFDSHGLFLLMLSDALTSDILKSDELQDKYLELLALFPAFFTVCSYEQRCDAGPWEELMLCNTSSCGLIASGQRAIMETINNNPDLKMKFHDFLVVLPSLRKEYQDKNLMTTITNSLSSEHIEKLYQKGYERVKKNLLLGAEAPNLDGSIINREGDASLLFLCVLKGALYYNDPQNIQKILNVTRSLIGPYGIYRYKNDSYQAVNYWIEFEHPSRIEGPATEYLSFLNRFGKGYLPHQQPYDSQWFFDSIFSIAYYRLSIMQTDSQYQEYYLKKGDIHLKRSLAQITGDNAYAANGEKLEEWQLAESINTLIDENGDIWPLHSPICPLGWANAALQMALSEARVAHVECSLLRSK